MFVSVRGRLSLVPAQNEHNRPLSIRGARVRALKATWQLAAVQRHARPWAPTFAARAPTLGGAAGSPSQAALRPHEPPVAAVSPARRWGSAEGPPSRHASYLGDRERVPATSILV